MRVAKDSIQDRELENADFQQTVSDQRAAQNILTIALQRLQQVYGFVQAPAMANSLPFCIVLYICEMKSMHRDFRRPNKVLLPRRQVWGRRGRARLRGCGAVRVDRRSRNADPEAAAKLLL